MSDERNKIEYARALEDFRRVRAKARLQHLWASITGENKDLLHYDEISRRVRPKGRSSKGIKEIPVEAIVGSVNRYQDFDRDFLPLHDEDLERWAQVKAAMTSPGTVGLPPIRVYKIGDAYFVLDGNHRVSIAREMGIETIEAYVTEIKTNVSISPDDTPEDIILKSEYSNFLDETNFDKIVPDANLEVTFPGLYQTLIEHIKVHRYYMGIEQAREIPWEEAVRHWFDHVYQPVVKVIREKGILSEFPDRTETDLYIWILDHQTYMEEALGWSIRPEKAASDLVSKRGRRLTKVVRQIGEKFINTILPDPLKGSSPPGEWHETKAVDQENLFTDILVAMDGSAESWITLEQAIVIAELEGADVRGLVIEDLEDNGERRISEDHISQAFSERLAQSGLKGKIAFTQGEIAETILERAKVNDLIVLKLTHPPSSNIFSRLGSGLRTIVRRSSRPILMVRNQVRPIQRLFLAYDGSPKGREALYIVAYLASRYDRELIVLAVHEDEEKGFKLLAEAENYLGECCMQGLFRKGSGKISKTILQVANEQNVDMIIMGGYGLSPLFEALFGSTVDGVLRGTRIPVLVCQ